MRKLVAVALLILVTTAIAAATPVPEVDPSTGIGALGLIAGALLVLRSRSKR